jgi:hypothetical protein
MNDAFYEPPRPNESAYYCALRWERIYRQRAGAAPFPNLAKQYLEQADRYASQAELAKRGGF